MPVHQRRHVCGETGLGRRQRVGRPRAARSPAGRRRRRRRRRHRRPPGAPAVGSDELVEIDREQRRALQSSPSRIGSGSCPRAGRQPGQRRRDPWSAARSATSASTVPGPAASTRASGRATPARRPTPDPYGRRRRDRAPCRVNGWAGRRSLAEVISNQRSAGRRCAAQTVRCCSSTVSSAVGRASSGVGNRLAAAGSTSRRCRRAAAVRRARRRRAGPAARARVRRRTRPDTATRRRCRRAHLSSPSSGSPECIRSDASMRSRSPASSCLALLGSIAAGQVTRARTTRRVRPALICPATRGRRHRSRSGAVAETRRAWRRGIRS